MFRHVLLASFAALALAGAAPAPAVQHVTLRFAATAAGVPVACDARIAGVGARASTIVPEDLRFYVSDVRLVGPGGAETPLALDDDHAWQSQGVALLSWCADGRADLHDTIAGTAPAGDYRGVRFSIGVPDRLNHADATIAQAPLNVTGMFWSWRDGYKFLRLEMRTFGPPGTRPSTWLVHLGSTACADDNGTTRCARANRPAVALTNFDWRRNVIAMDVHELLASTDVLARGSGCMMDSREACAGVLSALGLREDGSGASAQTVFRVR
jgi:uncharacterized repeat protein (TIGR04052 family)